MSDDLISRKAVIKAVDRHTREDGTLDDDISIILEEVKAAFDKEKVINDLLSASICSSPDEDSFIEMEEAIEIVEKSGIE